MSYFSNKLKELRRNKELSQEELGKLLGITKTGVSYWESEKSQPSHEVLYKLCDIFNVTMGELMGESENLKLNNLSRDIIKIKVLGSLPARVTIENADDIVDYEEIPKTWFKKGEFFALRINDDSMMPRYQNGDNVIFKKQNTVENEQNAVVCVNKAKVIFKKIIKTNKGIILQSLNSDYAPIQVLPDEAFEVLGIPYQIRSKRNL